MKRMVRSPLFLVACVVFIDFAGFGLVIPILPFWAERLGANAFGVGLVLTVYALAQFVFTPVLGSLSDRHGRRPVILSSLLIEALSFALTALAGTLPLLLLARLIGGLGASNIGSAQAVIADVTTPERRARGMGAVGAAIGLGFVVGPAVGGLLAHVSPTAPFFAAAGVALLNALLVFRFLPETRTASKASHSITPRRGTAAIREGWRFAIRNPAILRLVTINLLFTLAFSGMETVFALFTQHTFAWTAKQAEVANGYIFTYIGVIVVIMQGGLVGRLVKRWGEHALLTAGLILLAVGLALLPLSAQLAPILLALALLAIGDGAINPTTSALLSFASPEAAQGATLGLSQGLGGLGRVIGPLIAGGLYAALGAGVPFFAGALIALAAAALALPHLPIACKDASTLLPTHGRRDTTVAVLKPTGVRQPHTGRPMAAVHRARGRTASQRGSGKPLPHR